MFDTAYWIFGRHVFREEYMTAHVFPLMSSTMAYFVVFMAHLNATIELDVGQEVLR